MGLAGILPSKLFSSFLHPERGYEKGQEQLDQYYNQSQNYLQPYQQHGEEAYGHLNGALQNLLNPSQLYDQFVQQYQQSDASKYAQERALNQGNRAASSMGILGSTPALRAIQAGTAEIGAQDQERYLERLINQYLQGAGLAQGIYGTGAQAGSQLGQNALNMGNSSAQLAFGKQNAPGQLFNDLLKTGAYAASAGTGGGSAPWSTTGGGR
jgi:hypothetical protein